MYKNEAHPMQEPKPLAPDMTRDIADFHDKFRGLGEGAPVSPQELDDDLALFRIGFMIEELGEYAANSGFVNIARALHELHHGIKDKARWGVNRTEGGRNLEEQFDALIDLCYVARATTYHRDDDFATRWRPAKSANMSKVLAKSADESRRGYKFGVVKPKNWIKPDLSDLVK